MDCQVASTRVKAIISKIKALIRNKEVTEEGKSRLDSGWQYGGQKIIAEAANLKSEFEKINGKHVIECKVMHFYKSVDFENPTGRLILIPVNGDISIIPGGPMLADSSYYLEDERSLIGDGFDAIFVVLTKE
ncbi:hypothetical protein BO82DRAFT_360087 [Aspergillus uvarum CBS 121591]|uniref:Uncharacterized protein n=1 Tax=Aspergillus uvarum CBS 121591 TaxID=1448315 RepID=A0A319CIY5_9EURO|nr:hypothetical protein BO82DRAFT_360087 [Aspergillus uvarum CBS 121591]PYH75368.1 hypothetical protein BO82DRAFT_360087 [Aspergillus uvarum CBS 121591]